MARLDGPQTTGSLYIQPTRTSSGKHIDTWAFQSPLSHQRDPAIDKVVDSLKAEVYIYKDAGGISFKVEHPSFPNKALKGTDLDALRIQAQELLQQQHDMLLNCKWEDWLEVHVERKDEKVGRNGTYVGLTYMRVKRVTMPDGKTWGINCNGLATEMDTPKRNGDVEPQPTSLRDFRRSRPTDLEISFVRATPENIAALDDLTDKFRRLHASLSDFLQQDKVQLSLSNNLNLLVR